MADSSYRDYQRRVEARRLGRYFPDHEDEQVGHARIYGRPGGGIVVEDRYDDGSSEEHHFGPGQHEEARAHLHKLIADDFKEETNE
jgi:hypothetical protein